MLQVVLTPRLRSALDATLPLLRTTRPQLYHTLKTLLVAENIADERISGADEHDRLVSDIPLLDSLSLKEFVPVPVALLEEVSKAAVAEERRLATSDGMSMPPSRFHLHELMR